MFERGSGKKRIAIGLLAAAVFAAGCGSYDANENTLFIKKNGQVVETSVMTYDASYYDAAELESFINEELAAYDGEGEVTLENFEMEGRDATLTLTYSSGEAYAEFNKRTFFSGNVVQAQAAGFDFNVPFYSAESGASGDTESDDNAASRETVIDDPNLYAVVLSENCTVEVSGRIVFYSVNVFPSDKKTAIITGYSGDGVVSSPAYIVFR